MKQTEKLGLNLMEGADRVAPTPINENMERIEQAFADADTDLRKVESDLREAYDVMKQTVQQALAQAMGGGGHTARLAFGSYEGTASDLPTEDNYGKAAQITTEFKPVLVAVMAPDGDYLLLMYPSDITKDIKGSSAVANSRLTVTWNDHGVSWLHTPPAATPTFNVSGKTYHWVALGYSETPETEE